MNMVQSEVTIDKEGTMEGDSQVMGYGHPIYQLFALDQLRKKLRRVGTVERAIKELAKMGFKLVEGYL